MLLLMLLFMLMMQSLLLLCLLIMFLLLKKKVKEVKFISDEVIHKYIHEQKAKPTKYKDSSSVKVFNRFCKTRNGGDNLQIFKQVGELENILCQLFMTEKPKNKDKLY